MEQLLQVLKEMDKRDYSSRIEKFKATLTCENCPIDTYLFPHGVGCIYDIPEEVQSFFSDTVPIHNFDHRCPFAKYVIQEAERKLEESK